jgi:hypothetical protein
VCANGVREKGAEGKELATGNRPFCPGKLQHYVNYYSRPKMVQEEGWTVQGWPVHQTDWKREILRSVVDDA